MARAKIPFISMLAVLSGAGLQGCAPPQAAKPEIEAAKAFLRTQGQSQFGAALPLPANVDPATVGPKAQYSPAGSHLAIQTSDGDILIFDLSERTSYSLGERILNSAQTASLILCNWVADDTLFVAQTTASAPGVEGSPNSAPFEMSYRAVNLTTREDTWHAALGHRGSNAEFSFLSACPDGQWLVSRRGPTPSSAADYWLPGVWRFDPRVNQFVSRVVDAPAGAERLWPEMRGGWLLKVSSSPRANVFANAVNATFINGCSGATVSVDNLPPISPWGPLLTDDGRYLFTAEYRDELENWNPIVIRVADGQRLPLPEGDSWTPVTLSTARSTLLVALLQDSATHGKTLEWREIPLQSLIPGP